MKLGLSILIITAFTAIGNAQIQSNMTINKNAPVVQSKEIVILASPEKIWNILSDINNWDKWNKRISNPTLQTKIEEGAQFTWKTNGSKIKSVIHTLKKNEIIGWKGKAFGATAIHNWFIIPTENGTIVKVEESMEGWIIALMKKKMNEKLSDDMNFWLEKLKEESERL